MEAARPLLPCSSGKTEAPETKPADKCGGHGYLGCCPGGPDLGTLLSWAQTPDQGGEKQWVLGAMVLMAFVLAWLCGLILSEPAL